MNITEYFYMSYDKDVRKENEIYIVDKKSNELIFSFELRNDKCIFTLKQADGEISTEIFKDVSVAESTTEDLDRFDEIVKCFRESYSLNDKDYNVFNSFEDYKESQQSKINSSKNKIKSAGMRKHYEPRRFTDEQITKAQAVNIIELARSKGIELSGKNPNYKAKNYSGGLLFNESKNLFNWDAEHKGGGPIQFLMEFENLSWVNAVKELIGEEYEASNFRYEKRDIEEKKEMVLPTKNTNYKHVYAYLIKTRGIDKKIIDEFVKVGKIYENDKGSCVFVGYDNEGVAKYASVRSTSTNTKAFKKDVEGSDKAFCFNRPGTGEKLFVFEAPIDLLSYLTLSIQNGVDIEQNSYLCLGGIGTKALDHYLFEHTEIKKICVCTDSDEAGCRCLKRINDEYGSIYRISRHTPKTKDFNEDLVTKMNASKAIDRILPQNEPEAEACM